MGTAIGKLTAVDERCEEFNTKTLIRGLAEQGGDKEKFMTALTAFETVIVQTMQTLQEFLRPLQGMHAEKFKPVILQAVARGRKSKSSSDRLS